MKSTSKNIQPADQAEVWPALPYEAWKDTHETLHLWTQIVGKVRLKLSPFYNHWWHVTFYVTPRGLTTGEIPYGEGSFDVTFDFIEHQLVIRTSEGATSELSLIPRSVAAFYREFMDRLGALGIEVTINPVSCELPRPIRCDVDEEHASYDPVYAQRFWRILVQTDAVMRRYRSMFLGKSSPVHFFWGGFDLAVTFFSGRRAPPRPGADSVQREAYSHEVISCGFWPGDARFPEPAYYAYSAPPPTGLSTASVRPEQAFYSQKLGEFLLRYDDVRTAAAPEAALLDFFQSTYEAGVSLGHWDREALEHRAV
jgi:hypothetical protein